MRDLLLDPKKFLKALRGTSGLRFLYPLWEGSGIVATDVSGNGLHGTIDGVTLAQAGYNSRIPIAGSLDGLNDKITLPAGCSVKNLAALTLICVMNATDTADAKELYMEPTNDTATAVRLLLRIDTEEKIAAYARSATSVQASSSSVSNDSGLTGW